MAVLNALGSYERWLPYLLATIIAFPVAALVARLLAAARIRGGLPRAEAWRRSLTEVGMVLGTAPWLAMILAPLPAEPMLHLIPFEDLISQVAEEPLWWVVYQFVGNLVVFAAYGFLAPIRWRIRPVWVVATAAVASATAEFLQAALQLGRVTSVDDVLINSLGAGLAALCSRRWWATRRAEPTPPGC